VELTHEFTIARPVDDVWALLTDLRNVAAAVPGAAVADAESDGTHHGTLRMKLGAFTASFRGTAKYTEVDAAARRVVLVGGGTSAQGNASLRMVGTARPSDDGAATLVSLTSSVELTGRMAQFGTSMATDVAEQVLDQFVANLTRAFAGDGGEPSAASDTGATGRGGTTGAGQQAWSAPNADVLDLGTALLPGWANRVPQPALGLLLLLIGVVAGRASARGRRGWLVLVEPAQVQTLQAAAAPRHR
jgi:carbon monoxide dehydrogenase subunit G